MAAKALVLLRHATAVEEVVDPARPLSEVGKEEAAFTADGLCAYLELPSNFTPRADGVPCAVRIVHSAKERAAQTATIVKEALAKAGCEVDCAEAADALAPNADPKEALSLISSSATPLTILVGHLPLLHVCAESLGVAIAADKFSPAGGVLLEAQDSDKWALAHHILNRDAKKSWWIHGVSQYAPG